MTVVGSSSVDVPLRSIVIEGATVRFKASLPTDSSFTANLSTDAVLASLDRVEPLAADVVLCGHGEPFNASPGDAVAVARSAGVS